MLYFCNTVQQILHFSIFHFPVFIIFLNENLTHVLFFFIFVMVLQLSSMKTLRMWFSSMPHVGPLMGANKRTLFWRCKRIASEREYIWYPYTRGSENPSKKNVFFWNGVSEGSHSRPPGRSKSIVFKRIVHGRKPPSDAWPGPPMCSLCLLSVHINHHT